MKCFVRKMFLATEKKTDERKWENVISDGSINEIIYTVSNIYQRLLLFLLYNYLNVSCEHLYACMSWPCVFPLVFLVCGWCYAQKAAVVISLTVLEILEIEMTHATLWWVQIKVVCHPMLPILTPIKKSHRKYRYLLD